MVFCPQFLSHDSCAICGNPSCADAYDHQRISTDELQSLLKKSRVQHPFIDNIREQVQSYYESFRCQLDTLFKEDEVRVLQTLNRLEFVFLENKKVPLDLVSQILTGNYTNLPSKRLVKLLQELNQKPPASSVFYQQSMVQNIISKFLDKDNCQRRFQSIKKMRLSPVLKCQRDSKKELFKKVSIRRIDNPEQEEKTQLQSLVIKGVSYPSKTKELCLNNRGLTDRDMLSSIENLASLPNLLKLQLRNNRITELSCQVVAINLNRLIKLDIRGNKIRDRGVLSISKNLLHLQELYVCETELSDTGAQYLAQLQVLTLLWVENNSLTVKGARVILQMQKLKAVGLQGNCINSTQAEELKKMYTRGYLNI